MAFDTIGGPRHYHECLAQGREVYLFKDTKRKEKQEGSDTYPQKDLRKKMSHERNENFHSFHRDCIAHTVPSEPTAGVLTPSTASKSV